MTFFRQGEVIRYFYEHTNGNQCWNTWKEGLFMREIDSEYCYVFLLGNKTPSKVKFSDIKKKDELDISKEMELFEDKVRVNDSQIFSWKQVKQILKDAKRRKNA